VKVGWVGVEGERKEEGVAGGGGGEGRCGGGRVGG